MKKITVVLFSALLAVSLTACGGSNQTESTSSTPQASVASQVSDTQKTEEASDSGKTNNEESASESSETDSPTSEASKAESSKQESSTQESSKAESSKSESSTTPSGSTDGNIGPLLQSCFIDVVSSGSFYLDATMNGISAGQTVTDTPVILATDGQKMYMRMSTMGIEVTIMSDGEYVYMLNDQEKTGMKAAADSMSTDDVTSTIDTDGLELIDSGEEEFNGETCLFEKYTNEDDDSVVKYYFKDNALVGFHTSSGDEEVSLTYVDATTVVNKLTSDVPASLFVVPSDYTITDSTELAE